MDGKYIILVAEDNENDALLFRRTLKKVGITNRVEIVSNGEEVILYLEGKGRFADREANPLPALVILDIKMPKLTGLEVLEWICRHPKFKVVPTLIFTSSRHDRDICRAFEFGAHGFFVKPSGMEETEKIFRAIHDYWSVSLKPEPAQCMQLVGNPRTDETKPGSE